MRDQLRNNLGMKILSVAIAVLIWFLVSSSNDPITTKRFTNIKVNLINGEKLTESGMTYNVESGETVDIIVKGNKSVINMVSKSDFSAEADLSKLTEWGTANIVVIPSKYADRLDISLGNTQVVKVNVESLSSKSIKVTVNPVGEPEEDYVIGTASSTPTLIDVEGPESKLRRISGISVDLDVTGASETVKEKIKEADYVIYDQDGKEMTSETLTFAQKSLTAQIQILKSKEIRVRMKTVGTPAEGYSLASLEYEPKKIKIIGKEKEIEDLKEMVLDPVSIEGLAKNYSDEIELTEAFLKGETGKNIRLFDETVTAVSVKAIIEKTVTKTVQFHAKDIEIRNNNQNYNVTFDDDNDFSVTVRGASSLVNNLSISDLKPYINMETIRLPDDVNTEEHNMKFHYTEPEQIVVVSSPEGDIRITVSRQEE